MGVDLQERALGWMTPSFVSQQVSKWWYSPWLGAQEEKRQLEFSFGHTSRISILVQMLGGQLSKWYVYQDQFLHLPDWLGLSCFPNTWPLA